MPRPFAPEDASVLRRRGARGFLAVPILINFCEAEIGAAHSRGIHAPREWGVSATKRWRIKFPVQLACRKVARSFDKAPALPVAERVSARIISLPTFSALTRRQIEYVCGRLKELKKRSS